MERKVVEVVDAFCGRGRAHQIRHGRRPVLQQPLVGECGTIVLKVARLTSPAAFFRTELGPNLSLGAYPKPPCRRPFPRIGAPARSPVSFRPPRRAPPPGERTLQQANAISWDSHNLKHGGRSPDHSVADRRGSLVYLKNSMTWLSCFRLRRHDDSCGGAAARRDKKDSRSVRLMRHRGVFVIKLEQFPEVSQSATLTRRLHQRRTLASETLASR